MNILETNGPGKFDRKTFNDLSFKFAEKYKCH